MINLLGNYSYSLRVAKDVTELGVELYDIASKYELFNLFPQISEFASVANTTILAYQMIRKPYKVVQYGNELFTKPHTLALVVGNIAHIVNDIFKLIRAAQGLGILPANVYVIVGLGPLVPHICLIVTACSFVTSTLKAVRTWHSADPLLKQNLDNLQVLLNSKPALMQSTSAREYTELSRQVSAVYSAVLEHTSNESDAWNEWNTCVTMLNRPIHINNGTELTETIQHVESWLMNYSEHATDNPILALEKECLEFGLINFFSKLEEMTQSHSDKDLYKRKIRDLIQGKENRIYRSRYCSLKRGADLFAGAVAISLMLQADQNYKLFKWYTLLKKAGTVSGYIFNMNRLN